MSYERRNKMTNNYKPVFVTTSRWLLPKKYFDDEKYFIEIIQLKEEDLPEFPKSKKKYIVYLK